jgi:hypothetical protein
VLLRMTGALTYAHVILSFSEGSILILSTEPAIALHSLLDICGPGSAK